MFAKSIGILILTSLATAAFGATPGHFPTGGTGNGGVGHVPDDGGLSLKRCAHPTYDPLVVVEPTVRTTKQNFLLVPGEDLSDAKPCVKEAFNIISFPEYFEVKETTSGYMVRFIGRVEEQGNKTRTLLPQLEQKYEVAVQHGHLQKSKRLTRLFREAAQIGGIVTLTRDGELYTVERANTSVDSNGHVIIYNENDELIEIEISSRFVNGGYVIVKKFYLVDESGNRIRLIKVQELENGF